MRLPAALFVLALPLAAMAHRETVRPLEAIDAELVVVGRIVQVVPTHGSQGPRKVSVVIDRVLEGEAPGPALTFHAPHEHGPGWQVGSRALLLLQRHEGGWHAAATAAESAEATHGRDPAAAWLLARAHASATTPAPAPDAGTIEEAPARAPVVPGLAAGAFFALALLFVGAMVLRRPTWTVRRAPKISGGPVRPCQMPRPAPPPGSPLARRPRP